MSSSSSSLSAALPFPLPFGALPPELFDEVFALPEAANAPAFRFFPFPPPLSGSSSCPACAHPGMPGSNPPCVPSPSVMEK